MNSCRTTQNFYTAAYYLEPSSLPTPEPFIEWARFNIKAKRNIAPRDFASTITAVLSAYREFPDNTGHRTLARKTLDIFSIGNVLFGNCFPVEMDKQRDVLSRYGLIFPDGTPSYQPSHEMYYAILNDLEYSAGLPDPARRQLFAEAAKIIQPLELEAIQEVDRLVHEKHTAISHQENSQRMVDDLSMRYAHIMSKVQKGGLAIDPRLKNLFREVEKAEKFHVKYELDDDVDAIYKMFTERKYRRRTSGSRESEYDGDDDEVNGYDDSIWCSSRDFGSERNFIRWRLL
ncbi:hypothetical protein F5X99DRAFT_405936 [Biscogniauxia marginata]|nr:hypothetical protein F5X99DRAFT_405936 [Biscogniauxia marginata]